MYAEERRKRLVKTTRPRRHTLGRRNFTNSVHSLISVCMVEIITFITVQQVKRHEGCSIGGSRKATVKYHYFYRFFTYSVKRSLGRKALISDVKARCVRSPRGGRALSALKFSAINTQITSTLSLLRCQWSLRLSQP